MRALHVINSLVAGGAERLVRDLAPRLAARGITCSVLALDEEGDALSGELRASGVPVRFARAGGASPYSPARLADVARTIRSEAPDLVHAHLGPSFHWCAAASLAERRPVYLATEHAIANRRMGIRLARGPERWCYGRYGAIACVSAEAAEALVRWLGLARGKLRVIPNGVDLERCSGPGAPDAKLAAWAGERRLVVMTARFVPAKDHETACRALALLPESYALAFVGDGPTRPAVERRARELGLEGRCRFLGARGDVPAVLARADAYLQSSREEGFGIACLEAMAAGVPVAASEVGGLAPLARGAGLLFAPGDAEACARALRALCEDAAERSRAVAAGRERATAFSIERAADEYARLYAALAAAGGRMAP